MCAFFWYDFFFIFFYNINSMYNFILRIGRILFLSWLNVIFIFEILMKNYVLYTFAVYFIILLTFLKADRLLIHLTYISSKKDIDLLFLKIEIMKLNLISRFDLFQLFKSPNQLKIHSSFVYIVSHDRSEIVRKF